MLGLDGKENFKKLPNNFFYLNKFLRMLRGKTKGGGHGDIAKGILVNLGFYT